MHLYVTEQGARLNKQGGHLRITKGGELLDDVLFSDVESVVLFGAVQPTSEAMFGLLENGSEVAFMTRSGHYRGRLVSGSGKNVLLRLAQYDAFRDRAKSVKIAKGYIRRKLENGQCVLDAYGRNARNPFLFEERDAYVRAIDSVRNWEGYDLDELRGLEGNAARIYFGAFARCLMHGVAFPGRVYYPSTDPVNALLSFGYSLVARELESLLELYGFDPCLGFMHAPSYGRRSLSLDLLEEFRHPLVDRLVLTLFNKRILCEDDFEERADADCRKGGLYLKRDSVCVFIRHYEEFCDSANRIYKDSGEISWRRVMRLRVEAFRRALLDGTDVEPFECGGLVE
jgi:CRISP-associated protein Cas1